MLPHFYNPTNGDYCRRQQLFAHCAWSLSDAAGQVATGAIGTIHLLAQDGALAETEQHAAQSVGQVERGAGAVEGADQMAGQAVVVQLTGERAIASGVVFLQAEEVHSEGGAAARLTNLNTYLLRASLHETSTEVTFQARATPSHKSKHLSQNIVIFQNC